MTKFRMSIEDYRRFCQGFFLLLPPNSELEEKLRAMDPLEFEGWRTGIFRAYDAYREPIRELVLQIRGDYEPRHDPNREQADPLASPENWRFKQKYEKVFKDTLEEFFASISAYNRKASELVHHKEAKAMEHRLRITVDGVEYVALEVFDLLRAGFDSGECSVWVVNVNGVRRLVANDSVSLQFVDNSYLSDRIEECKKTIQDCERAMSMLV